jgi:drug/metabolite transporter (DMT)-like permease
VGTPLRGRRAWGALGLALAGVALAVGNIDAANVPPIGALALIGASPVIYSVWIVLSARLSGEARSGVGSQAGGGADPMAAGVVMLSATAATYWIGTVALGRPVLPGQVPAQAWLGLFGIGAVSTFLAVLTFYAAAHRIGAARASLISTVEPIWTIALASVLFAESLAPLQLLGGALILLGVVISQTGSAASTATAELRIADE